MVHASGVHATIAGVALGLVVPATPEATRRALRLAALPEESLAERWEHRWRPLSAGIAVPVFALFAAGVTLSVGALQTTFADPVAQGVALGLVLGKPLGILAPPGWWPASRAPRWRPVSAGRTSPPSGWSAGSGSPCPCWWVSSRSARAARRTSTSSWPCWSRRSSRPCSVAPRCSSANRHHAHVAATASRPDRGTG